MCTGYKWLKPLQDSGGILIPKVKTEGSVNHVNLIFLSPYQSKYH